MFKRRQPDVLVVGAGPVGLATALILAKHGVSVEVIDDDDDTSRPPYTVVLHPATTEILAGLGLSAELATRSTPVSQITVYDREEPRGSLRFEDHGAGAPVLTLPYDQFVEVLERRVREHKIPIHFQHRLSQLELIEPLRIKAVVEKLGVDGGGYSIPDSLLVVEDEIVLEPKLVVGADGFHSTVRRRAGIEMDSIGAPHAYVEVELETPLDVHGEARVIVGDQTTDVFWPGRDGKCRWVLEVKPGDVQPPRWTPVGTREDHAVPAALVERYLASRAPWFGGTRVEPDDYLDEVHFQPALAREFGKGVVWLAGDAAHVTGPIGSQSLNAGIQEGNELAMAVLLMKRNLADLSVLTHYDRAGRERWRSLLALDWRPEHGARAEPYIRDHAAEVLSAIPGSGEDFWRLARQVGIDVV
ncbi:MAG: NAD(P)/FAD-dependent oxidoreductase [Polyangiaceae bacterium]